MRDETENLKLRYEHENNCNYLVLEEKRGLANDYQVTMLNKNEIQHFLRFDIRLVNGVSYIYYDISSKQQLTKLFEYGKLNLDDVKAVCRSLSETARLAQNYMLDLDRILLEPRYMYMDMFDRSLWFIYLPAEEIREFSKGVRRLFEYILEHFDHGSGKREVVQLYELYQHILVGDYDAQNLMLLFHDEKPEEPQIEKDVSKESENIDNTERVESKVNRESRMNKEKQSDIIIDTVVKEVVTDEKEVYDPVPAQIVKGLRIAAILIMLHGLIHVFLPQYAVGRMTLPQAVICVVVGGLLYALQYNAGKKVRSARKLINIRKEIPYRIKRPNQSDDTIRNKAASTNNSQNTKEPTKEKERKISKINAENDLNITGFAGKASDKWEENDNLEKERTTKEYVEKESTSNEYEDIDLNHTMLLSDYIEKENPQARLRLIRQSVDEQTINSEKEAYIDKKEIVPEHFPCVIGSMKSLVDFVVDKPYISKMHTCIQKKDEDYYVEDLNSTNGTFVNELRIYGQYPEALHPGDILRIGLLTYKVEIT